MNCKKLFIALVLILGMLPASAQLLPFSLEVRGGLNRSKPSVEDGVKLKSAYSYRADAVLDFKMGFGFFTRTGLTLTEKNLKQEYRDEDIYENLKIKAQYLQVPVMVGYKFGIPMLGSINVAGGMYFGYGIGGKAKYKEGYIDYMTGGVIEEEVDKTNTFENVYRRFDTGVAVSAGVEISRVTFNLGYEHGLVKVIRGGEVNIKNRSVYASLGFRIL